MAMLGFEQILFFALAFATMSAIAWSAVMLLEQREDPLNDRLQELQANVSSVGRAQRRAARSNSFLYAVSMLPGMDDYLHSTEKELAQAGVRNRQALAYFVLFHMTFLLAVLGGMVYLQR